MSNKRKVALIGAGFIAPVHLTALQSIRKVRVSAIVDPNMARAEGLARQAGATAYPSIEAMLEADRPDAAHVVTPPPLHEATTLPLLAAGVPVLLEKPMAQDAEECTRLIAAAEEGGTSLAINHNFIHHPAFVRARKMLESGRYGRLRRVQMRYAAPLRQMTARAFGHWMFNSPRNLLLEQAVHPLSQLDVLIGEVSDVQVQPGPVRRPADGIELVTDYAISLQGARADAQLQIVLGANFPSWTMSLLCDDGVIDADIFESRVTAQRPHASIPPIDFAKRSFGVSRRAASAGLGGLSGFAREILRLGPLSDGFNRSIRSSIEHFHDRLFFDEPFIDLEGSRLVSLCEKIAQGITVRTPQAPAVPAADARYDVAVLGGTGFIGSRLVEELTARGQKVAVMARSLGNLPSIFHQENVGLFSGSISDEAKVREVIRRAPKVVNLAHGGGGATRDAIAEAMVGGARTVAAAASAEGAERLIFISSSAALYLGDPETTVTMSTPVDPEPDTRADYARAKILAEHAMEESDGVPIAILRPAIVVGPGASPFHSALGAYENETHCQGWNKGKNPLPFVLVDDVVSAIIATLDADIETIEGKAFNLVGGVRWTARQYTEELAKATGRPLKFHSSRLFMLMASEWAKWTAKKVAGRKGLLTPSSRDFKSRGMVAPIGTAAEQSALGWSPCTDEAQFRAQAILSHADNPA
ncbi:Gfo/Idh/MocA family oxidoreductase [Parvularcula marina]|uniref:Gfo/Idh/MocA family oxidoreductase n=1 Tax=Parvularcula marina TaxID=2292771 RepID=UPI0035110F13